MSKTVTRREKLVRMIVVAVFCALSYACQFVFRIHVSFLTFDAKDAVMAISMYPTSLDDLMNVADNGDVMPPKSTWFEPKLRSGLLIHKI